MGSGGFYAGIAPGTYSLEGKISATVDKDLTISRVNTTLADGKTYSFYQSGFYDGTAKSVEAFVVEDPYEANIDFSVAYVRFVNAISNSQPMTLYAKNTTTLAEVPLGGLVAYKSAGAFTAIPSGVYDVGARIVFLGQQPRGDDTCGVTYPGDLDVIVRRFEGLLVGAQLVVLESRVDSELGLLRECRDSQQRGHRNNCHALQQFADGRFEHGENSF